MRHARRQAREVALQALYAWQLSGGDPLAEARSNEAYEKTEFLEELLRGVRERAAELEQLITPHLDRSSPGSRRSSAPSSTSAPTSSPTIPKTPFKVVLNEAVELGKSFGGTDGHHFVNGVLEKIAEALRPEEVARSRKIA